ncbi:MAG: prepilin-type N-terminal cleavage/methylation domain-containing protein [Candidatus Abyssobacteria bacterium SURF_5]|uniref:Prepilin-type N-terminal cleavage/methylation domain-containing protein n=1 Tax=Abyssobacteria bacterium (strain SURF_5) TaxID=2093360 RepID=A0A3A4NXH3_ABYX5|nr:MAG: prepilin-type N-terminal cleavage/methylation domain-containing protein [Candidatus Abyssubacteria bacterium SURF_5]
MNRSQSQSGFTLLEVMVSVAIIAAVLVTLLGTHLMSLNLAHKNQEQTLEATLARQKMEEAFTTPYDSLNNDSGDFGPEYPELNWEIFVEETKVENLKNLKITVSSAERTFELHTAFSKEAVE